MNATQRYSLRTIAILIMVLCSILLALTVQGQSPEPISYTSFEGDILTMYPYSGEHVAILVPNLSYDESVLNNMVSGYDDAYSPITLRPLLTSMNKHFFMNLDEIFGFTPIRLSISRQMKAVQ